MKYVKHQRRNATSVMAGNFDMQPARDVLTRLLNGVGSYEEVKRCGKTRRIRRNEKRGLDLERKEKFSAESSRVKAYVTGAPEGNLPSIPVLLPSQLSIKRVAIKKGWKGWVEGSPPPSEKLINLDDVRILQERKTRSGKNFDAIGVGIEGWV